jgi:hypothetical protein
VRDPGRCAIRDNNDEQNIFESAIHGNSPTPPELPFQSPKRPCLSTHPPREVWAVTQKPLRTSETPPQIYRGPGSKCQD